MAVIHGRRTVNGKPQEFIPLCNTRMGMRGQQIITDNTEEVTCKKCLNVVGKIKNGV